MKEWAPARAYGSAEEIAEARILDGVHSKRGIGKRANKEGWRRQPRKGRGGGYEFSILDLVLEESQRTAWETYCLRTEAKLPAVPVESAAAVREGAIPSSIVGGAAGTTLALDDAIALPATSAYESVRAALRREAEGKPQSARDAATQDAAAVRRAYELIE